MILIVSVAWALNILGLSVGWLTITVVVLLVVAALAIKPLAENLVSGVVLTVRPSFGVGDEIEIAGFIGEIIEFTDRSTVLRLRDGRRVHMPNSDVLQQTVVVYTTEQSRRSSVEVAISEDADIARAGAAILAGLAGLETVHDQPPPNVLAQSIDEGIGLSVRFWHDSDISSGNIAIDGAVRAIKAALEESGIALAPSMEIQVDTTPSGTPDSSGEST